MAVNISPPVICSLHKPGKVSFSRVHRWLSPRLGRFFSISGPESPRLFYLPGTYRDPSSSCTTRKSYRRYYTYDCCQTFSLSLGRRKHVCRLLKPSNQVEINKSIRLAAGAEEFPISLTKKPEGLSLNWSKIASHLIADVYQTRWRYTCPSIYKYVSIDKIVNDDVRNIIQKAGPDERERERKKSKEKSGWWHHTLLRMIATGMPWNY